MGLRKRSKRFPQPGRSGGGTAAAGTANWLYGAHPVLAALANPNRRCYRLLVTSEAARQLPDPPPGPAPEVVDRQRLAELLPAGAVHQGMALLADPLAEPDLAAACTARPEARNLVVVLDQVTDPQNIGAILRSAAAFGARALVLTERHAPAATAALAKAASGALEVVPMVRVGNLARALDELAELGYWRIGLAAAAPRPLAETPGGDRVALVLGAEGHGLRRLTAERCDFLACLPTAPAMPSLNVSNAAAVAMYELTRRPPGA